MMIMFSESCVYRETGTGKLSSQAFSSPFFLSTVMLRLFKLVLTLDYGSQALSQLKKVSRAGSEKALCGFKLFRL